MLGLFSTFEMQWHMKFVLTPILLLSGLLTIPSFALPYLKPVQMLSPLTLPIKLIYQENKFRTYSYLSFSNYIFCLYLQNTNQIRY